MDTPDSHSLAGREVHLLGPCMGKLPKTQVGTTIQKRLMQLCAPELVVVPKKLWEQNVVSWKAADDVGNALVTKDSWLGLQNAITAIG